MRKQLWASSILTSVLVAAVTACGSSSGPSDPSIITVAKGAALHQADSCDDLLAQIQTDAIAKLDETVERYKSQDYYYGGGEVDGDGGVVGRPDNNSGDGDGAGTSTDSGGETTGSDGSPSAPTDPGKGDDGSNGDGDGDAEGPSGHSETNTQVKDVDEADIVKIADGGERIFLIHGSEFKILKAWPAADTAEAGAAQVAGTPVELFVHEGKATVFSNVYPEDLPGTDAKDACWYSQSYTQVSVFDVTGDTPVLEREMIFEGNYVSSRRNDDVVRVIVGGGFQGRDIFYPEVDRYDSFGREKAEERLEADLKQWRDSVVYDIKNTTLKDWLPERFERVDGEWAAIPGQCDGFYIPEPGLVQSGITQVVTFDPATSHSPNVVAVLGGTETVYANNESLYLAHSDYRWDTFGQGEGPRTAVHKLNLSVQGASYNASGFVPGVPLNQFSLDEAGGVLRIATTINNWDDPVENRLFTLRGAEGELSILDKSEPFGEERETIKAVRFIGDRGYVVTFETTDPLYAFDLSDPTDITVLGELHIPGFSEYIHPLGDHHLLTIGRNANQDGVALQIFDVSDPTAPAQDAIFNLEGYGYSEAEHNHKAFTFVDDYFEDGDDLLLFPFVNYGDGYDIKYRSTLEVFRISESDGFAQLGTIDHTQLINRDCADFEQSGVPCHYYYGDEMRRGMQIDDYIYSLSQGGLTVHELEQLAAGPVATVEFDEPTYVWQEGCSYGGYDTDYAVGEPGSDTAGTTTTGSEMVDPLPAAGGASNE